MSDLKALVSNNALNLPPEKLQSLGNMISRGTLSFLSPEKEAAPFMLYYLGDTLENVAQKTNYPVDIIYLTAMKYNWLEKADNLRKDLVDTGINNVKKDLIQLLLVATHTTLQKQLADIIAGRLDPSKCDLLPKNIHGLEKLMNMVDSLSPKVDDKASGGVSVNINLTSSGDRELPIDVTPNKAKHLISQIK